MPHIETLIQDLRYSACMFRRTPIFTFVAVVSLALGLGANAAIFSLVSGLLLRPLPYRDADRLIASSGIYPRAAVPYFQQHSRSLDIAAVGPAKLENLSVNGVATRVLTSSVSANVLSVIGVSVERGRGFQPGEDSPGRDRIVLIGDSLWGDYFGRDPGIVGRMIHVNGEQREVIGVLPATFAYPSAGVRIWQPLLLDPSNFNQYWGEDFVPFVARLRKGATVAGATDEIRLLTSAFRKTFPYPMSRDWNANPSAIPLREDLVGDVKAKLLILTAAVATLLMIVCANVAGLLLSRATTRRKEIALRASLGATRQRIVRQLLTESFALSLAGACLGLLVGWTLLSAFKSVLPETIPGVAQAGIDWRVAAMVSALAILSGLGFGLAPALSTSSVDLTETLKTGSQRTTSGFWVRFRSSLISGEVALTFVLVVATGLLLRSLEVISETNLGFETAHVVVSQVNPDPGACEQRVACVAKYDRILTRTMQLASVEDAALANAVPLDGALPTVAIDIEGQPKTADHPSPVVWFGAVTPDYYRILGLRLLAGRFTARYDTAGSAPVAVISASLARRLWPHESPVGKHFKVSGGKDWRTVVGIVGDVHQAGIVHALPEWIPGAVYMPYAQAEQQDGRIPAAMSLLVKTKADDPGLASQLRRIVTDEAPDTPVQPAHPLQQVVSLATSQSRATLRLFSFFASAAILLAVTGLYGLMSYWVGQRTYEIGLRVAIGATPRQMVELVMRQGLRVLAYGLTGGIAAALVLMRFLSSLLYGVQATDVRTFAVVSAILLLTTLLATAVPACAALRIDSVKALRAE